jgi:hypothetical protein
MDKTTLLTDVNQITGRSETSIDSELLEALIEVSVVTRYLQASTTGTTTASQNYIDKPSDMAGREIDGLVINGEKYDPISWDDFLEGKEEGYCVRGDRIYLLPTPSDAYAYTVYYAQLHPSSLASILIPDVYKPAIKHCVAAKVYEKYEIEDKAAIQIGKFEYEMKKYSGYGQPPPVAKPYRGI